MLLSLYLVRHAPVLEPKGVIYGDDVVYDILGQKEALQHLAHTLPHPEKSDWYSSGVERAHQAALSTLSLMGISTPEALVQKDDGFREQDFGSLIGKKHEEVIEHLKFIDGKIWAPNPPEGESIDQLRKRVHTALDKIISTAKQNNKESIVIFCHGGMIRAAHLILKKLDDTDYIKLDTPPLKEHLYLID